MKAGSRVKIEGLESEAGKLLNGLEGVVDHYSNQSERYGISLSGDSELKMIKATNLRSLDPAKDSVDSPVFSGEDEMIKHLKLLGMPPAMLEGLTAAQKKEMFEMTQKQSILERAKRAIGIDATEEAEFNDVDGLYEWKDAGDKIVIKVTGCTGKVRCDLQHDSIHIQHEDNVILNAPLFQHIVPKESKWEQSNDGKLVLKMQKLQKMRWLCVTR
ncbi:unnamed protein product [Cylindrotheca closterium]|uniref:CS domain-containing protein n=1 Tax=Cylindrotheca closterium TaxID=2856 RepID=A0AAD2G4U1_9STRA|nr:unnamed protein product [Cylindrotheca closterium]